MEYETNVSYNKTYVQIRVHKQVTVDLLDRFLHDALEKSKKLDINNYLFDLRHATNQTELFDHFKYVFEKSKQMGFKTHGKHALLVDPKNKTDYILVETYLSKAGYQGRLFIDEFSAIDWLEIPENH